MLPLNDPQPGPGRIPGLNESGYGGLDHAFNGGGDNFSNQPIPNPSTEPHPLAGLGGNDPPSLGFGSGQG